MAKTKRKIHIAGEEWQYWLSGHISKLPFDVLDEVADGFFTNAGPEDMLDWPTEAIKMGQAYPAASSALMLYWEKSDGGWFIFMGNDIEEIEQRVVSELNLVISA